MINLHLVRNSVLGDSRVIKEVRSLADSGIFSAVRVAGFSASNRDLEFNLGSVGVHCIGLRSTALPKDVISQAVKFVEWRRRILSLYCQLPVSVVHCHDLEPLPIAVALKNRTGCKIIYDAHELETERTGYVGFRKALNVHLESRLINHVDGLLTVSPSIVKWYKEKYPGLQIELVRNVPEVSCSGIEMRDLRGEFGVPDDALLFAYVGGIKRGRGVEDLLEVFGRDGVKHHLLFVGSGPMAGIVTAKAEICRRIHITDPVAPEMVVSLIRSVDIGVCLIEDVSLSYRYSLPNKLFECILAGVPVVVSKLPDMSALVEEHNAGWVLGGGSNDFSDFLRTIDRAGAIRKREALASSSGSISWAFESERLIDFYKGVLSVS